MSARDLVGYLAGQTRNAAWRNPHQRGGYFDQFEQRLVRGHHSLFAEQRGHSDAHIMCAAAIATDHVFDGIEIISLSRIEELSPPWASRKVREDYRKVGVWRNLGDTIERCHSFAALLFDAHQEPEGDVHRSLTEMISGSFLGDAISRFMGLLGFDAACSERAQGLDRGLFDRVVFDNLHALIYHFCAAFIRGDEREVAQLRAALELYPDVLPLGHSGNVLLCLGY